MLRKTIAAFVCLLLLASCAFGQTVKIRVFDDTNTEIAAMAQTISSGADATITFANQITSKRTIRIYSTNTLSSTSLPDASLGRLTIIGSANSTGRLNILIADGDQFLPVVPVNSLTDFPSLPQADTLRPGLVNFGGTLPNTDGTAFAAQAHNYDADPFPSTSANNVDAGIYGGGVARSGMF